MKGSAGSGKSVDTAQNYILRLMKDKGRNLLCVRKSDVTNRDSTFAELQGAIFRMFGENYKKYWYINSSNMILECKANHNQIIFRGVNDDKQREKLKSITFKRGKLTEGVVSKETQLNALSMVKDAAAEIEKMKEEEQSTLDPVMDRAFGGDSNEPVLEK